MKRTQSLLTTLLISVAFLSGCEDSGSDTDSAVEEIVKISGSSISEFNEKLDETIEIIGGLPEDEISASSHGLRCDSEIGCFENQCLTYTQYPMSSRLTGSNTAVIQSYQSVIEIDESRGIATVYYRYFEEQDNCEGDEWEIHMDKGSVYDIELESGTTKLGTIAMNQVYHQGHLFRASLRPYEDTRRIDFEVVTNAEGEEELCISDGSASDAEDIRSYDATPNGISYEYCYARL